METAGTLLASARRRHGLSQSQLAARARTSQAAISRIERDLVSPSISTLANLLDLMGERLTLETEQIDYGHDRTLFERTLRETPERRIANQASWSRGMHEPRRAADAETFDPIPLLEVLASARVDFVVIGGVAGGSYGSAYGTFDVDVAYARDGDNLERLAAVLESVGVTLLDAQPDLPFGSDVKTLASGADFTFTTHLGSLDLRADPDGAPPYRDLKAAGTKITVSGLEIIVASLDHLIAMNEAAGRTKDLLRATEYRALSDELRAPPKPE